MKWKKVLCGILAVCLISGMSFSEGVYAETIITADETIPADTEKTPGNEDIAFVGVGESDAVSVQSFEELVQALENASTDETAPTVIELTESFDLTVPVTVKENTYVMLTSKSESACCLRYTGATLTQTNGAVLTVNGTLTVKNVVFDAQYKGRVCCIGVKSSGTGCYAGTLSLENGAVIQNGRESANARNGLGVWLTKGSLEYHAVFTMEEGSKVCGCRSYGANSVEGIGVSVQDYGIFEMHGGEICNNEDVGSGKQNSPCASGGGVAVSGNDALFTMTNGRISENIIGGDGGGIYLGTARASAVLKGKAVVSANRACASEINASTSSGRGGGVYINNGTLIIEEEAQISENAVSTTRVSITDGSGSKQLGSGGGIFLYQGQVQQNGGQVMNNAAACMYEEGTADTGNYALANGGGVCVEQGTYTMNDGSISGNTVTSTLIQNSRSGNGGGVYVGFTASTEKCVSGKFLCSGGEITGNTAQGHGGGAYIENTARVETSAMGGSTAVTLEACASPEFCVNGNAVITGNSTGDVQEDLYLPKTATDAKGIEYPVLLTVSGGLEDQADIRLSAEQAKEGMAVAKGTDSYYVKEEDLSRITFLLEGSAENQYELDLNNVNQIILAEKKERTPIADGNIMFVSGEVQSDTYETAYNGELNQPVIKVLLNETELIPDQDYTTAYYQNKDAGTAKVSVFGKGAYKGTLSEEFTITPHAVTDEDQDFVISAVPDKYQTGDQITPEVTVNYKGESLAKDVDYTVSYGENTDSGTGTVTVSCIDGSNFTGSKTIFFSILQSENVQLIHNESEFMRAVKEAVSVADTGSDADAETNSNADIDTNSDADTAAILVLANDIALTLANDSGGREAVKLPDTGYICLYGNGHTLSMADDVSLLPTEEEPEKSLFILPGNGDSGSRLVLSDIVIDGGYHGRLFFVEKGADLTLEDTAVLQKGRISTKSAALYKGHFIYNAGTTRLNGAVLSNVSSAYNGAVYNDTTGNLTIEKGTLFEKLSTVSGGALINAGCCTFTDGIFSGCNGSSSYGAAVTNLENASFVMNGGEITGSNCTQPAVYNAGEFTMNGGEISGNRNIYVTISFSGGGTVCNWGADAVFTMHGGSICENTAYTAGGGIYAYSGNVLIDGEDALISDNQAFYAMTSASNQKNGYANGGGIFVYGSNAVVTLREGKICNNMAGFDAPPERLNQLTYSANGGGVYVQNGVFRMEGGQIFGNRLQAQAENVSQHRGFGAAIYVNGSGIFGMSGGTIGGESDGDANQSDFANGGGVYIANTDTSGVSASAGFELGGGKITDTVFMCANTYINLTSVLPENEVYHLYYERFSIGSVLAKYADAIENSQIQQSDAEHFVVDNYKDTEISVEEQERVIRFGKIKLSDCTISMPTETYTYTGKPVRAQVIVKDMLGNDISSAVLCDYENNTDVGTASVTLRGNGKTVEGEYTGLTFKIEPASIALASVTLSKTDFVYEAGVSQYCPDVTVKWNGLLLVKDKDYSVEYFNHTGIGTATVKINGKGNFNSFIFKRFTISSAEKPVTAPVKQSKQSFLGKTVYNKVYGNKAFKLNLSAKDNAKLTYKSANKKIVTVNSKGKVTIKGTGRTTITVTAAATKNYLKGTKKVTITVKPKKMAKPTVSNPDAKTLLLKWKKDTKAKGYQIQIAQNKKFTKDVKYYVIKNNKTTSRKITGLKAGKTYYVRIQAYQLVNKKALTGSYSKTVKKKIAH